MACLRGQVWGESSTECRSEHRRTEQSKEPSPVRDSSPRTKVRRRRGKEEEEEEGERKSTSTEAITALPYLEQMDGKRSGRYDKMHPQQALVLKERSSSSYTPLA